MRGGFVFYNHNQKRSASSAKSAGEKYSPRPMKSMQSVGTLKNYVGKRNRRKVLNQYAAFKVLENQRFSASIQNSFDNHFLISDWSFYHH